MTPWSSVERFSTREEQYPEGGDQVEEIDALSGEQMGMKVDVALRWQIDPQQAPRIFREIGAQERIESMVKNAIRNGVRDGMVVYSINDIAERNRIATTMEAGRTRSTISLSRSQGPSQRAAAGDASAGRWSATIPATIYRG